MTDKEREITFTLSGQAVYESKVSVALFTKTLQAIQQGLVQIGKAKIEHEISRPGPSPSIVRTQCELFLIRTEPGTLSATLELPPQEDPLFPEFKKDIGQEALNDMRVVVDSIINNNPQELRIAIPDSEYRYRILTTVSQALPRKGAD